VLAFAPALPLASASRVLFQIVGARVTRAGIATLFTFVVSGHWHVRASDGHGRFYAPARLDAAYDGRGNR